jgi:hypothetical protein
LPHAKEVLPHPSATLLLVALLAGFGHFDGH